MSFLSRLLTNLRALVTRARDERDLDDELRAYVDEAIARGMAAGQTRAEAERTARAAMGSVAAVKDYTRDVGWETFVESVWQDGRFAARTFRKHRAFTAAAVLTLALGVGANAAVFSVVEAVLLRPLPYADPARLVRIWKTNPSQGIARGDVSPGSFVDWRSRARSFESLGLYLLPRDWLLAFGDGNEQAVVRGVLASPGVFEVLGVPPMLGRAFRPEAQQTPPDGDEREILLSHGLWQRRFGGDPEVVGKTIRLEGEVPLTVVGVMPPGFDFPGKVEAWRSEPIFGPIGGARRLFRYYGRIARLRPGASIDAARADLRVVAAQSAAEYPNGNAGFGVRVEPLADSVVGDVRLGLTLLLGVVACVLAIGCANVTSLMLTRASARRREIAMRAALGASTRRLLQQSVTEAAALALAGSGLGLALGYAATRVLVALAPPGLPRLDEVAFGGPLLAVVAVVMALVVIITGVAPVVELRRGVDPQTLLSKSASSRSTRAVSSGWIVAGQVALTLALVVGAALLVRSFVRLRHVDLGFDAAAVVTAELRLPTSRFQVDRPWPQLREAYEHVLAEVARLPLVDRVGGVTGLPLTDASTMTTFWLDDGSGARPDSTKQFKAALRVVTPDYFSAMRVPLVGGRLIDASDRLPNDALSAPAADARQRPAGVAVVNQAFVRRFWPDGTPIGQRIKMLDHWAASSTTVVGVVGDVRSDSVAEASAPAIYVPWSEIPGFRLSLAIRTRGSFEAIEPALRDRIRQIDPRLIVSAVRPMDAIVAGAVSRPFFNLILVASFAAVALALTAVGVYGVVAHLVAGRTREIGVRVALGATRTNVMRLVLTQGLRPVLAGTVAGLAGALAVVRVGRTLLFETSAFDPASFVVALATIVAVALVSAWLPTRRATQVDPIVVLRAE